MGNLGRPEDDMPWWVVQKVAEDFRANGIRARWLHEMGEPLLYPRLAEAIDLFPGVGVSTNVMMLDADYGRELLATSLERIRLCVDTINSWAAGWAKRGWKRKSGPIANLELVKELWRLANAHPDVTLRWIKAHDGSRWNEYVDALASGSS